jgi:hypothetical protein
VFRIRSAKERGASPPRFLPAKTLGIFPAFMSAGAAESILVTTFKGFRSLKIIDLFVAIHRSESGNIHPITCWYQTFTWQLAYHVHRRSLKSFGYTA